MKNIYLNEENNCIESLVIDIYDNVERIKNIFNKISDVVYETKDFYKCETADVYRDKFENFETNFEIVNKNFLSYAEDLIKLKNEHQKINEEVAQRMSKITKEIENIDIIWG